MKPFITKPTSITLLTLALKTILLIVLFAGFPFFIGMVTYNYNVEAKSLLEVPFIDRVEAL